MPLYTVPWLFADDLIALALVLALLIWAVVVWRRLGQKKDRVLRGFLLLSFITLVGFGGVAVVNLAIGRPQLDMHEEGMCYYARSGENHALPWRDIARLEKYHSPRRYFDTWIGNRNRRRADNDGHADLVEGFRLSLWSCRGESCISFINTRYSAEDEAIALSLWRKAQESSLHPPLQCNRLAPGKGWPWVQDFIRR